MNSKPTNQEVREIAQQSYTSNGIVKKRYDKKIIVTNREWTIKDPQRQQYLGPNGAKKNSKTKSNLQKKHASAKEEQ